MTAIEKIISDLPTSELIDKLNNLEVDLILTKYVEELSKRNLTEEERNIVKGNAHVQLTHLKQVVKVLNNQIQMINKL